MREQRLEAKARFCLATGIRPDDYDLMPAELRNAFIREVNKANQRRR